MIHDGQGLNVLISVCLLVPRLYHRILRVDGCCLLYRRSHSISGNEQKWLRGMQSVTCSSEQQLLQASSEQPHITFI